MSIEANIQKVEKRVTPAYERVGRAPEVVGYLQINKAKTALELFDIMQSVDSVKPSITDFGESR